MSGAPEECEACGYNLEFVTCFDDAQVSDVDHAWNLYVCRSCGAICKHDVWSHGGRRWLWPDGSMTIEANGVTCEISGDGWEVSIS